MERNEVNSEGYQYESRIVAFLDILGFRKKVFQGRSKAVEIIKNIEAALSHSEEMMKLEGPDSISINLFSDCFCLSCENNELNRLVRELSFLQLWLTQNNIFVKGAVSSGLHFESQHMIFSEGLINAYDLQTRDKFPRILINEEIVRRMKEETCADYGDKLVEYLIVAPDGVYFLDYLQILTQEGLMGYKEAILSGHKQAIVQEVKSNQGTYSIIEKYRWLSEYHNTKFHQLYDLDDYYRDYQQEILDQMFIPDEIFPSFKIGALNFSKIKRNSHK
ncbi:MAG: hypothetical protein ACYSWZ_13000 [Planctomycetota bacterium]|jgi:hypothetical protein